MASILTGCSQIFQKHISPFTHGYDFVKAEDNYSFCLSCSRFQLPYNIDILNKSNGNLMKAVQNEKRKNGAKQSELLFDYLPDELLIRIFSYFSLTNIENFITILALEKVSSPRVHHLLDGQIWKNTSELVIGTHPQLPATKYLFHNVHLTLKPFLQIVPKITKVVINIDKFNPLCRGLMHKRFLPLMKRYARKFDLQHLVVSPIKSYNDKMLVKYFLRAGQGSLETIELEGNAGIFADILRLLEDCTCLKNLKMSTYLNLPQIQLKSLKSLEVLELSHCTPVVLEYIENNPNLRILRFTNPLRDLRHDVIERMMDFFKRTNNNIYEMEIEICARFDHLCRLSHLVDYAPCLQVIKLTFHPYLKLPWAHTEILKLLENVPVMIVDDVKIAITFKHSVTDYDEKLSILHNLLNSFDVSLVPEHENMWTFVRGNLSVTLKLEMIDESAVCHFDSDDDEDDANIMIYDGDDDEYL